MSSISDQVAQNPVQFFPLGTGEVVTPNTLQVMKKVVNASIRNPYVRRWAEKIVERSGRDQSDQVESTYWFLIHHTNYLRDPFGLEFIKTPPVSLQMLEMGEIPSLDCDDMTVLSMSLLKSIGFRVAFRAASYNIQKKFSHVYGLVYIKGYGWTPFDLVPQWGVGTEAPGATRTMDLEA